MYLNSINDKRNIYFSRILVILFAGLLIFFPKDGFEGAKNGLLLWFNTVLPTLLPFMIISNLIVNMDLAKIVGNFLYPVFKLIFGVSPNGCYPILIGMLSGMPLGAKTIADLVERNDISLREGQYLLSFSNNASPMFIMSFIAITQLNQPDLGGILLFINFISGFIGAILYFRVGSKINDTFKTKSNNLHANNLTVMETSTSQVTEERDIKFDFSILDKSIMDSFEVITKVGGYIILFSIPAQIISSSNSIDAWLKIILIGILEITTGINYVSLANIDFNVKIVLIVAITAFGGLSALAQTNSVINTTRLSIFTYFKNKVLQMLIAILLALILIN